MTYWTTFLFHDYPAPFRLKQVLQAPDLTSPQASEDGTAPDSFSNPAFVHIALLQRQGFKIECEDCDSTIGRPRGYRELFLASGVPILHDAVLGAALKTVRFLIEVCGADPLKQDGSGKSAETKSRRAVELRLGSGAGAGAAERVALYLRSYRLGFDESSSYLHGAAGPTSTTTTNLEDFLKNERFSSFGWCGVWTGINYYSTTRPGPDQPEKPQFLPIAVLAGAMSGAVRGGHLQRVRDLVEGYLLPAVVERRSRVGFFLLDHDAEASEEVRLCMQSSLRSAIRFGQINIVKYLAEQERGLSSTDGGADEFTGLSPLEEAEQLKILGGSHREVAEYFGLAGPDEVGGAQAGDEDTPVAQNAGDQPDGNANAHDQLDEDGNANAGDQPDGNANAGDHLPDQDANAGEQPDEDGNANAGEQPDGNEQDGRGDKEEEDGGQVNVLQEGENVPPPRITGAHQPQPRSQRAAGGFLTGKAGRTALVPVLGAALAAGAYYFFNGLSPPPPSIPPCSCEFVPRQEAAGALGSLSSPTCSVAPLLSSSLSSEQRGALPACWEEDDNGQIVKLHGNVDLIFRGFARRSPTAERWNDFDWCDVLSEDETGSAGGGEPRPRTCAVRSFGDARIELRDSSKRTKKRGKTPVSTRRRQKEKAGRVIGTFDLVGY